MTSDQGKKEKFRKKITEYMDRAEQLKSFVTEAKNGTYYYYPVVQRAGKFSTVMVTIKSNKGKSLLS